MTGLTQDRWSEVVTAALLGTDRRPLPDAPPGGEGTGDPVSTLLSLAAMHRSAAQAASRLSSCPSPERAPGASLPPAPPAAQVLLSELLSAPEPLLVNLWLAACVRAGRAAAVEHWPRLADLAARSRRYDRALLRGVLGPRGTWWLGQNPRWARLAQPDERPAAAAAGDVGPPPEGQRSAAMPADLGSADATQWQQVWARISQAFGSTGADGPDGPLRQEHHP